MREAYAGRRILHVSSAAADRASTHANALTSKEGLKKEPFSNERRASDMKCCCYWGSKTLSGRSQPNELGATAHPA